MSKESDELKLRRSEAARQVKENAAYQEAFLMLKSTLIDKISATDTKDTEAMRDAIQMLKNLNRIERIINGFYDSGKIVLEKRRKLGFLPKVI